MSEDPRLGDVPENPPPAPQAHEAMPQAQDAKRRFLIKALKIGVAMPVVMTISRPAFADSTGSSTSS
jgi:hypothetical protein